MEMHARFTDLHGNVQGIHGFAWKGIANSCIGMPMHGQFMDFNVNARELIDSHRSAQRIHGSPWKYTGDSWIGMPMHGGLMDLHGNVWGIQ